MAKTSKSHHTALVMIPPEEIWEPIQAIRRQHDAKVGRWMPHVTLLYPFVPKRRFGEVGERIAEVAEELESFPITLATFSYFRHRHDNHILWLKPEPEDRVIDLQTRLWRAFPDYNDTRRHKGGFNPHLSVGQQQGHDEAMALLESLQADWEPLTFRCDRVHLIARGSPPDDVFEVEETFVFS